MDGHVREATDEELYAYEAHQAALEAAEERAWRQDGGWAKFVDPEASGDDLGALEGAGPGAPAGPGSAPPARRLTPPLLTGGVKQTVGTIDKQAEWGSIDYLTVSVPTGSDVHRRLMDQTVLEETGSARPGFEKSEKRAILGGYVWRRLEPRQDCKLWGRAYESWEASSGEGACLADLVGDGVCRPSRVDVAFDVPVSADYLSDSFVDEFCPMDRRGENGLGFKLGISGEGRTNTRYVGGKSSERRVRIYRKDLQSALVAELYGPTLRVELVLKDVEAQRWWQVFVEDRQAAWRAASTIVAKMTGWAPMAGEGVSLPELAPEPATDVIQGYLSFMSQHAVTLAGFASAGLPVVAHAQRVAARASRSSIWRLRRRVEELGGLWGLVVVIERMLFGDGDAELAAEAVSAGH